MKNFWAMITACEDDLNYNGIYLNRSTIVDLVRAFRRAEAKGENGLGFVEFVKEKVKPKKNNRYFN